ncbi:hypothetical protein [uncultured Duncaniella sp.]|uniref:hypothetical protein n=1 Tax=uncultured Duncaniella sp. TaxID=2768039 RepID=UPI0026109960|nr:hypothetical protein [uncultured Duncaniella sp.]
MKRIAAIALSAAIAGSTLMVGQTNVSFWMDLGGAGVSVNHSTGHRLPPPPPRRVVHYVDYGWDGPSHHYGKHHSKKLKKRYKEYRKAQKKYYKEVYKHHKRHSRHHWDDD